MKQFSRGRVRLQKLREPHWTVVNYVFPLQRPWFYLSILIFFKFTHTTSSRNFFRKETVALRVACRRHLKAVLVRASKQFKRVETCYLKERKNKFTLINCFIHACPCPQVIAISTCGHMNIGYPIISFGSSVRLAQTRQTKQPLGWEVFVK